MKGSAQPETISVLARYVHVCFKNKIRMLSFDLHCSCGYVHALSGSVVHMWLCLYVYMYVYDSLISLPFS